MIIFMELHGADGRSSLLRGDRPTGLKPFAQAGVAITRLLDIG
jgi:hypothetical protein